MKNKYTPFIDSLKTIAPIVCKDMEEKILKDHRFNVQAEKRLQYMLARKLIYYEYKKELNVNLLGLEIGCMMKDHLPKSNAKEDRKAKNERGFCSKWVDFVLVDSGWTTWLWLELKTLQIGHKQKLKEFLYYDILGRKFDDKIVVNEIDADETIKLFDGNKPMERNKNFLEFGPFQEKYKNCQHHLKAGLIFRLYSDNEKSAEKKESAIKLESAIKQEIDNAGLVIEDLHLIQNSHRLSIIYPKPAS